LEALIRQQIDLARSTIAKYGYDFPATVRVARNRANPQYVSVGFNFGPPILGQTSNDWNYGFTTVAIVYPDGRIAT